VKTSWLQRMDLWVRHLLPAGLTLVLVLIGALPTHLPAFAEISPQMPLIGVFYWAIYRPDLLPASMAFAVGLMTDILMGTPLGVSPLVYLLVHGLTLSQRRFFLGKPFVVTWSCFGVMTAVALLLEWLLVSMLVDALVPLRPVMFSLLMSVSIYPVLSWLFGRIHAAMLRAE